MSDKELVARLRALKEQGAQELADIIERDGIDAVPEGQRVRLAAAMVYAEAEEADAVAGRLRDLTLLIDGPPGPEAGRFVDVVDSDGAGVRLGDWYETPDGLWALDFRAVLPEPREPS
jgi:hypothetical protein